MSTSVLARLKVKPVPNKIEQIKVRIAEPATEERVEIQTKLLDKTKDNTINRAEFIKKLKGVVESSKVKESAPQPIISKPPVKKAKKIAKKLKLIPDHLHPIINPYIVTCYNTIPRNILVRFRY